MWFRFGVNALAVAAVTVAVGAACVATAGGACIAISIGSFTVDGAVVTGGAAAGAGTSMLEYRATTRRRTAGGYLAAGALGVTGGIPSRGCGCRRGRSLKLCSQKPGRASNVEPFGKGDVARAVLRVYVLLREGGLAVARLKDRQMIAARAYRWAKSEIEFNVFRNTKAGPLAWQHLAERSGAGFPVAVRLPGRG